MVATIDIKEHMEVIGADGAFVGKVDKIEGARIKLTKDDGHGGKRDHHHFLPLGLVAEVEGDKVRLSATAANALTFQEEETGAAATDGNASAKESAFAFQQTPETGTASKIGEKLTAMMPANKGLAVGAAALGAAAVGAAALGAAKLIKNRKADSDAIPLDDDENMRLISSSKVEGTKVYDRDGVNIGTIQNFMVDKYTGRVAYAVLSFGGTFGFGATLFPLPWAALDYDEGRDGYALDITKAQLGDAPKFEARDTPEFDAAYRTRIVAFYRAM